MSIKKLPILYIAILLAVFPVIASDSFGETKQGDEVTITQLCANETSLCDYCNITSIRYPKNGTEFINEIAMVKSKTEFNYSFDSSNMPLGKYIVNGKCGAGTELEVWSASFELTPSGYTQTTSQGVVSGIVILIVFLIGMVMIIAGLFIFSRDGLWFLGIIIIGFGVGMFIYTLSLAVVYTRDLSYTSGTSGTQEGIFVVFMRFIKYSMLLVIPILLLTVRKILKDKKKRNEENDGWDFNEY